MSFGLAPAILAFAWGLWPLQRLGWAVGFLYVTAAAMRLARFNIQTNTVADKRYFAGLPSPAAAAVIVSTVYLYPCGLQDGAQALPALALVLVPALLMVSTIRFRSVKAIEVGWRRSYLAIFVAAVALSLDRGLPAHGAGRDGRTPYVLFGLVTLGHRAYPSPASRCRKSRHGTTGRRSVTVVPCSFRLSTSIRPPLNSMLRRAIGSPRPVPVVLVEK